MQTIESIVRGEIADFIHNPITVAGGHQFHQYENVRKTHLYLNSQFYSKNNTSTDYPLIDGVDAPEDDRIFFQVTLPRVKAVKRFFDIDNADVVLDEIDPASELAIQLLNKEYDRFGEKYNLAYEYNEMKDPLIEYGSLVLEVHKNKKPEVIPLQNYFLDPSVKRSKDSRFNTIKYTMTPAQLREKVKDGWNEEAIEKLIAAAGKKGNAANSYEDDEGVNKITSAPLIEVYKRYGLLPKSMIDGGTDESEVMTLTITGFLDGAFKSADGKKIKADSDDGMCLYKQEWKADLPILDHHLFKTHGRWQGIGITELLYPIQQRMNEVCNQKRISMEISSLHLFQSADPGLLNNILTDLENGAVIQSRAGITPIANEERNLPAFDSEIITYQTQGDKLAFANDLLSGGDIASSTPATNAVIQNNNQVLVHLQDRENFTNFVANEYIKRHVVPQLIKEMDDEHFLRMAAESDDILNIDDKMVDLKFFEVVKEQAIKTGKMMDIMVGEDLKQKIRNKLRTKGPNRYVKVLQGYYKKKLGDVQVHIGNEKKDMAKMANNQISFMQMLQDPTMVTDPVKRLFLTDYARSIGMDTARLELAYARADAAPTPVQSLPTAQPEMSEEMAEAGVAKVM